MTRFAPLLPLLLLMACTSPLPAPDAAVSGDAARLDAGRSDVDAFGTDASAPDAASTDVTTVRVVYPAGHTITLRGSGAPLSWSAGMATTELGGGVYELAIHGLASEIELKPLLDDTTYARGANYHVVPGQTIEIAPHFTATSGRVTTLIASWAPSALSDTRPVYAYLPAAYDENTAARFTVLYMHDGQNLFDPSLSFGGVEWGVDETLDAAGEGGRCPDASPCAYDGDCAGARCDALGDTIVIGVGNTANRIPDYTPTADPGYGGGAGDVYLDALVDDLLPRVNAMLRTRTTRDETAMMGSSLGGLISAHAGVVRPETFGRIGALSPSTWWDSTVLITEVGTIPSRPTRVLRVYVDSGDSGASMDDVMDTASLAAAYRTAGYVEGSDLHYLVQPGGQHNETYWAQRLPGALDFLLPRRERVLR